MNKYRVETRTMRTIAGGLVKYTVHIDAQGSCRRVEFPPVRLGSGNDPVTVHIAYTVAVRRLKARPELRHATEDTLFAQTGLPSLRARDSVDEFFAEIYRRYHIHAIRSARGVPKPALPEFRAASPRMAAFMDRRYAAVLEVQ